MHAPRFGRYMKGVGVVACTVAMGVATCGTVAGASSTGRTASSVGATKSKKHFTVGYILTAPIEALEAIGGGLKIEAKKLGMTVVTESADFSSDTQLQAMQALEAKHVNAIITAPLVPPTFEQAAEVAQKDGIVVMTYDKAGPGITTAIVNPDEAAAKTVVEKLAADIKKKGKSCQLGIIDGTPAAAALEHRNEGFAAGASAAGCTVLATQTATQTTITQGATIASAWKSQFGSKMTGIVTANDTISLGVVTAKDPTFDPIVIGMNGEPAALQAVDLGEFAFDDGLENAVMGEGLGYAVYQKLTGHKVPASVTSTYVLITTKTAKTYVKYADSTVLSESAGKVTFKKKNGSYKLEWTPPSR